MYDKNKVFLLKIFSRSGQSQAVRHPRPGVEIEPVVGQVETFPRVTSQTPGQRRQSELLGGLLLLLIRPLREDEGPVKVDDAGGRGGVFYHGGPELQPERLERHNNSGGQIDSSNKNHDVFLWFSLPVYLWNRSCCNLWRLSCGSFIMKYSIENNTLMQSREGCSE